MKKENPKNDKRKRSCKYAQYANIDIAKSRNMQTDQLSKRKAIHATQIYFVYFLGFSKLNDFALKESDSIYVEKKAID